MLDSELTRNCKFIPRFPRLDSSPKN